MEMLLMGVCLSLFGVAVTCLVFAAATRGHAVESGTAEKKTQEGDKCDDEATEIGARFGG